MQPMISPVELCSDDLVAATITLKGKKVVICSAYLPGEKIDPTEELTKVLAYTQRNKSEIIVGCDANAHHTIWGSTGINRRDHESRHNSHRPSDEEQVLTESTPLINRFPETNLPQRRNLSTLVTVGVLFVVLIVGVIIGIRLLVLQNDSENVLPPEPEEMALRIIPRQGWDNGTAPPASSGYPADVLVAVQTDTTPCADEQSCTKLLREMKSRSGQDLPHNFLLSSNGQAYEAMGWHTPDLFRVNSSLVLAFIGNFTESAPPLEQMKAVQQFVGFAQSQQRLKSSFRIIGKNTKYSPKYLYQSLMTYPQWSNEFSDL